MLYGHAPLRELIKMLCWDMGNELSPLSLQRDVTLLKGFKYSIRFAAYILVNTVVKLGSRSWESQQCAQQFFTFLNKRVLFYKSIKTS